MKRSISKQCMSAVFLVLIIGITACENSSSVAEQTTESSFGVNSSPRSMPTTSSTSTFDSTAISLQSGVTSGTVDLEAVDSQQGLLTFDATSADPSSLSSLISLSTPNESPSSDPGMMNIPYQVYKYTPQNISLNGGSQLQFDVDGSSYSDNLSGWQLDMTDWMGEFLYYAYVGTVHKTSTTKKSQPKFSTDNSVNFKEMTSQEIKKWFKDKGYKVKKLGNRQFKLTYTMGKGTPHKLLIYSLFDARTPEIEPMGVTNNNEKLSEILVKKKNGKRKEITRTSSSLFKKKTKKIFMKMISNN